LAAYVQVPVEKALSESSFLCTERFRAQPRLHPLFHSALDYNASGCAADADPYGLGLGNPTWRDPDWLRLFAPARLRLIETGESKVKQPDDMIAITCSNLPDQRSVGPSIQLVQYWLANTHNGGANGLFCDGHVEHGKQDRWIEKTDRARRRWNNDHEPHPAALR
jgi:prepilin-type processing-associated H-X9-DG protein